MRWGDSNSGCRWVRDRLPLLVGDELTGLERRKAERHLIACLDCRRERTALSRSLSALQAAATISPVGEQERAGSLWPALERQIRESRHESRRPVFSWLDVADWLETRLRLRPSPTVLTLALAGLTLLAGGLWSRHQTSLATAEILAAGRPVDSRYVSSPAPVMIVTDVGSNVTQTESTSASHVDYDLDHGTPMGPETRGVKSSY